MTGADPGMGKSSPVLWQPNYANSAFFFWSYITHLVPTNLDTSTGPRYWALYLHLPLRLTETCYSRNTYEVLVITIRRMEHIHSFTKGIRVSVKIVLHVSACLSKTKCVEGRPLSFQLRAHMFIFLLHGYCLYSRINWLYIFIERE